MKNLLIVSTLVALLCVPAFGWKAETNSTTDTTLYTPERPGEMLTGFKASVRASWVASGPTTNDWDEIPQGGQIDSSWIPTNGVTGADINDASITTADLATNAVKSANIDDGTIVAADLAAAFLGATSNVFLYTVAVDTAGAITNRLSFTNGVFKILN